MVKFKYILLGMFFVSFLLFAVPLVAFAQEGEPGGGVSQDLNATIDTVVSFIRDITLSALRFGLFLSGIIFLVTVVWGSARGSIATAIGNHLQASAGLVTAIMAVGSLVLVLIAVPLTNVVTQTLTDQFLTPENLSMDIAALVDGSGNAGGSSTNLDPQTILQIPELQQTVEDIAFGAIRFALSLGVIATVVATFLGAFDTQLGSLFGGGMLASRGILRILAAIGQLIILVISLPIAKSILNTLVPRLLNLEIQLPF